MEATATTAAPTVRDTVEDPMDREVPVRRRLPTPATGGGPMILGGDVSQAPRPVFPTMTYWTIPT